MKITPVIFVGVMAVGAVAAGIWLKDLWLPLFQPSAPPVKVGCVVPLSGDVSTDGYSVQKAMELAKRELRATNIEIIPMDSQCEADKAVAAAKSLIDQGVVAIVGDVCSSATMEIVPLVEKAGIPLISPASTSPALSGISPYFFRTIPSDDLQGKFAASLLTERGYKQIMVFYSNEAYGKGFYEVLKREFTKQGNSVVGVPISSGKLAFAAEIRQIETTKPEAIFIVTADTTSPAALIRQIRDKKIMTPIYGAEGLKNDLLLANAGENSTEGMILSSVSAGTKAFVSLYKAEYELEPATYAAQGYDAFKVLYLALKEQQKTGKPLHEIMASITFEGMSGTIAFDDKHEVGGDYDLWIVKGKKFVLMQ